MRKPAMHVLATLKVAVPSCASWMSMATLVMFFRKVLFTNDLHQAH